jgi:hypothetical protein
LSRTPRELKEGRKRGATQISDGPSRRMMTDEANETVEDSVGKSDGCNTGDVILEHPYKT